MTVYSDDEDRLRFLSILTDVAETDGLACHAYCLMPNHYHLVVTTARANLSSAFKRLNGTYAQWWNRRHVRVGHVFQGRFWAQVVQHDVYFATVCRYVVLNPVRAGLVAAAQDWPWSSYQATVGRTIAPPFLKLGDLLAQFDARDEGAARHRFATFVAADGAASRRPPSRPVLGDDPFVRRFEPWVRRANPEVPHRARLTRTDLATIFAGAATRDQRAQRMALARRQGHAVVDIARYLGLHASTVSKAIASLRDGVRS